MLVLQSLILGLFVALIAFYAKFRWSRRRLYELASKFPGPKGLPFIGIGHKFLNKSFKAVLDVVLELSDGHGEEPVGAWLGPEFLVFADTPETIKTVLNSEHCHDKAKVYDVFLARNGVGFVGGDIWKKHRKILNPAFSLNIVHQLVPIFDEKSKILVKNMKSLVGGEQFDAFDRLSACSLETFLRGSMDLDRDIQSNYDKDEYLAHMDKFLAIVMAKVVNVFYKFQPYYRLSDLYKREQKHFVNGIEKFGYEIYDQSEALMESSRVDDEFSKKPKIFIKTLLNPANDFTKQQIVDEINLMVIAGSESSARTIATTLLLMAMHPEVQESVVSELKEVLGEFDVGSSIDHTALNKLTYLDMVIKESMRLFPVVAVVARNVTNEFKIKNYTLPKDATVVISIMKVQRNKKYWGDDAEQFRPERFESGSFAKIHPYAFIPFTAGPRICIGWRYAMLFMKSVLANFLMKYEVSTIMKFDEIELELQFLVKFVQGYMISINERQLKT